MPPTPTTITRYSMPPLTSFCCVYRHYDGKYRNSMEADVSDFADYGYDMCRSGRPPALPANLTQLDELAARQMTAEAYGYVAGGAGTEATMRANREAFDRRRLVPRVLRDVSAPDLSVELFAPTGFATTVPAPVLLGPVGVLATVHPDGDLAVARAAAAVGVPLVLSLAASHSIEEVAAASGGGQRISAVPAGSWGSELRVGSGVPARGWRSCPLLGRRHDPDGQRPEVRLARSGVHQGALGRPGPAEGHIASRRRAAGRGFRCRRHRRLQPRRAPGRRGDRDARRIASRGRRGRRQADRTARQRRPHRRRRGEGPRPWCTRRPDRQAL